MVDTHMLDSRMFSSIAGSILAPDEVDPAAETVVDGPCPCLPPPSRYATMTGSGEIEPLVPRVDAY